MDGRGWMAKLQRGIPIVGGGRGNSRMVSLRAAVSGGQPHEE